MSEEAKVRLNLEAAGFLSGIAALKKAVEQFEHSVQQVGEAAEKTGKKTSAWRSGLSAGLGTMRGELGKLGGELKGLATQAVTLGGALSIGAGVKMATELQSKYRDIAFRIRAGTGAAMDYVTVQKEVEATAGRWSQANNEVADTFNAIFQDVGDVEFAKAGMEEVAKAARASGAPMGALTGLVGELNERFGITSKELPDVMASLVSLGSNGGVPLENLGEEFARMGASAKLAGMEGKSGLERVVSLLGAADGATKKTFAAVGQLFDTLADPDKVKTIQKDLGIKLVSKDGAVKKDALDQILAKTKGDAAKIAQIFGTRDAGKLAAKLGGTYAQALKDSGGDTKKALQLFNDALSEQTKSVMSAAKLEQEAQERLKDPKAKLQAAMNQFAKAFEKPEMVEAVEKLAESLPKLASMLGKVVGFAAANPVTAAAGALGVKVLMPSMAKAGIEFAKSAAVNSSWGKAAAGFASVAGPAVGIAAGAAIAYAIGQAMIDEAFSAKEKEQESIITAGADTGNVIRSKDPKKMEEHAERLRKSIAEGKAQDEGISGMANGALRGTANFFGADIKEDPTKGMVRDAEKELATIEAAIAAQKKSTDSLSRLDDTAARAAKTLEGLAGVKGSNGLPGQPPTGNGSTKP